MIKEKIKNGEIVTFKLATGEEIIGKFIDSTKEEVKIKFPINIQIQMVNQNQAGIGFAPFMIGLIEGEPVSFVTSQLVTLPQPARKDVASEYTKATTGIEVPTKGLIL